jgi:2-polyprenyl-6-methoxyphenol hydroxylase-like FAD-dependent oxidoreductase
LVVSAVKVVGSKVAVVGGSIAGCAAAIALNRAGCDVQVFERSRSELEDRGSGIVIPIALRDELVAGGYMPPDYSGLQRTGGRLWLLHDGSDLGHIMWHQPAAGFVNNWGVLWQCVRAGVGEQRYHEGVAVEVLEEGTDGVVVRLGAGATERFDILVGADGYRSSLRARLQPGSKPDYAGYILWRGNYPESRVSDRTAIDRADEIGALLTVCFDGGHGVLYMIPNFDHRTDPGHRRVNWAIYTAQPDGLDFSEPSSIPPGSVTGELYAHLDRVLSTSFPPAMEALGRLSPIEEVSLQPIYDERVDHYTGVRALLIGDAGTVTRPHTGSGATKALQDALALERLAHEHVDWETLLPAYDLERVEAGNRLVELGRRIGRAQVEETPNWAAMTPDDFDAWTKATLAGERRSASR